MGKKSGGGLCGWKCKLTILLLIVVFVDYFGLYNVPYVHEINQKFTHPVLDPILHKYVGNKLGGSAGGVDGMPSSLNQLNSLPVDNNITLVSMRATGVLSNGTFIVSGSAILHGAVKNDKFGVVVVSSYKLLSPSVYSSKRGLSATELNDYTKYYNEVNGTITVLYEAGNIQPTLEAGAMNREVAVFSNVACVPVKNTDYNVLKWIIMKGYRDALQPTGTQILLLRRGGSGWLFIGKSILSVSTAVLMTPENLGFHISVSS